MLEAISEKPSDLPLDEPWYRLTPRQQRAALCGDEEHWAEVSAERQLRVREELASGSRAVGQPPFGQQPGSPAPFRLPLSRAVPGHRGRIATVVLPSSVTDQKWQENATVRPAMAAACNPKQRPCGSAACDAAAVLPDAAC
ncbi:MAG UNVERIFIED_CONTAM: hypothetical protein LVR18_10490 [Planctomycetaceae bacterium]